jgi:mRNA interferase YafQ
MAKLQAQFTPAFKRDIKRLDKKHIDDAPLKEVINLIIENSTESLLTLKHRHKMHSLVGNWAGSNEYHVCNAGNWLLVWCEFDGIALLQRTGTHEEIFR